VTVDQRKLPSFTWIFMVAFLAVLGALAGGWVLLHQAAGNEAELVTGAALLAAGYLGVVAILVTLPIALNLFATRKSLHRHQQDLMISLGDRLQGISVLMNLISEQHDALHRAVQEEISRQNWDVAYLLANDIESQFGYKQQADAFRAQIASQRAEIQRRQLGELLAPVDRHIRAESWGAALQEAQQIMEQYPNDPHVQKLPEEIESRRQQRKQQLRDSWQEAVNRRDVDGSIEILKKLDLYLTPTEADAMQETARNVFKEKREALRIHFAQAVKENRIAEAIRLGDEIMNDFPNTRMAQEVREMMEGLRQRIQEPQASSA
jgi:hypothetical protein